MKKYEKIRYNLIFCLLLTCITAKLSGQPVANFNATPVSGCAPLVVNFTDISTGNPTSWSWNLGNGTLSSLRNPSTTYINTGIYTVTLTATNASGSNSITKTSFITVYDKPRVNFTTTDSSQCIPFITTFTDLSTTTFGNITAWEWHFDDGMSSREQNPSHLFTQMGNYNISLKATNNAGCFNILNKLAYIKAAEPLKASFSFSQPVKCKPPETIAFANNTQGPGTINYVWNFGDGNNSTSANPLHTYTEGGTYSLNLVATNTIGCIDSLTLTDTLTIKNNQTIIESVDTVCIHKMMTLKNASIPVAIATRWIFDDGTTSFGNNVSKTWNTAGNHTAKLICNYGQCTDSITKIITVLEPPVADFTASDSLFCIIPSTVNFRDISAGALYWKWSFGNGDTSNLQNPSYTYTTEGDYDVRLTVTNTPGCINTVAKYRFVRIASPTSSFDNKEGGGCIPYIFRPYPSVTSLDSVNSYLWDFGDGTTSASRYPTHIYTDTGIYTVKFYITTITGCRDSVIMDSAVQTGTPPLVDFNFSTGEVCPRVPVNFTSLAVPASRWLWHFGDGNSATAQNPSYEYLDSGLYSVKLIAWNKGCSDSVTKNKIIRVLPGLARFAPIFNCNNKRSVYFKDSSIVPQSWLWNFGDGITTIEQNPTHLFTNYQSYTVTLTTTSGRCTNTDSLIVNIINDTADFSVTKSIGCKNEHLSFYNIIPNKSNIAAYTWNFGDGIIDSTTAPDTVHHTYVNGGQYTVSLTVEDINGCTSDKIKATLIYISSPRAAFGLNSAGGCSNEQVTFTDSSTGNITEWYWNFGDGNTRRNTTAQTTIPHTYSITGQYFPSLVVIDAANCIDSFMLPLPVSITRPVADFTAANFITCPDDNVRFQNNSAGENLMYRWNFGDNTFSTEQSPLKQYDGDGDFTPSLVIIDTFGCADSIIKPDYIKVKAIIASFSTQDTVGLCIPYPAAFVNTSVNATSYLWDFGDGGFSSNPNPQYYYSEAGTFYAKLIARRSSTCISKDSVRIRISAPSGELSYNPTFGCAPLHVSFNVATTDKVSFIWDFNDGTSYISRDSSVNYTYSLSGHFLPRVILKDSLGCAVPLFGADSIMLYSTTINFNVTDSIVCYGDNVQFIDSSFSGSPELSRRWDFGDGNFSSALNPVHQYASPGIYTIKLIVTTRYGCKDSLVKNNYIRVYSKPAVSIGGYNPFYCGATSIMFIANLLGNSSDNISWKWNFSNGNSSTVQNPPAQYFINNGQQEVLLTASYYEGCADTAVALFTINPLPTVFAGTDTAMCYGSSLQLFASGANSYNWHSTATLSCSNCPNPLINAADDVYVYVTGQSIEGCESTDSLFINVKKPISLIVPAAVSTCAGKPVQINLQGAEKYRWFPNEGLSNPSIGNPVASPTATTIYKVIASDNLNCFTDSALLTVIVYQLPKVNIGDDITLLASDPITLAPVYSNDIILYNWSPSTGLSCIDCPNPVAAPQKNITYKLEVTNGGGCKASDAVNILVKCDNASVSIPTAFSPNNDGRNDKFSPLGSGNVIVSSFKIFNRLGQLIFINGNFRLDDKSGGWDGRFKGQEQPPGNYVYAIEFVCSNNEVSVANGSVVLVR